MGLLEGMLGGVAGGATEMLNRNHAMDKEDETARLESLRSEIAENRQKNIDEWRINKEQEVKAKERTRVADVIGNGSTIDDQIAAARNSGDIDLAGQLESSKVRQSQINTSEATAKYHDRMAGVAEKNANTQAEYKGLLGGIKTSGKPDALSKLYKPSDFKIKDANTGENRVDAIGFDAAMGIGNAAVGAGLSPAEAHAKSLVIIEEARNRSGGDPAKYKAELTTLMRALSGSDSPAKKQAAAQPKSGEAPAAQAKPQASKPAQTVAAQKQDPLNGMTASQARAKKEQLLKDRQRWAGKSGAEPLVAEIDGLLERIQNNDF